MPPMVDVKTTFFWNREKMFLSGLPAFCARRELKVAGGVEKVPKGIVIYNVSQ